MRDDADEINDRLVGDIEAVLNRFYPGWIVNPSDKRKGLLSPRIKGKSKKPTSSFTINLTGQRAGTWYRFSQDVGGGMVALVFYAERGSVPSSKQDWADAFRIAREFLGIPTHGARQISDEEKRRIEENRERERKEREEKRAEQERLASEARARKTQTAVEIWQNAVPLKGSHAEAYLVSRGISPVAEWPWDPADVLRFHPSINYEPNWREGMWPALIGLVVDAFGDPTSVWQVYLDRKEARKAPLEMNKIGRGPTDGGAIRIGGLAARVGIAEGMETALGVWDLEFYRMPVWSTMSTSGMRSFDFPMEVESISIFQDGDKGLVHKQTGKIMQPPGLAAALALQHRAKEAGIKSNLNEMPILGDGLDLKGVFNEREKIR